MTPSTTEDSHSLVQKLRSEAGDALRSVARYDEEAYDVLYMRKNVDSIYSEEELDDIFDDLRLEGWGRDSLESLFNTGQLQCSVYGFEDAMMFHFVTDDFGGVLITYDRGAGIETERFIRACKSEL